MANDGVSGVYSLVLVLGMTGILIGVVLTVLGKFGDSVLGTNNKSLYKPYLGINDTVNAIYDIPNTWLPVIVIVAIAGIILFLVMRGIGGSQVTNNRGERR
jgi:choline-glycine betaine transporter